MVVVYSTDSTGAVTASNMHMHVEFSCRQGRKRMTILVFAISKWNVVSYCQIVAVEVTGIN